MPCLYLQSCSVKTNLLPSGDDTVSKESKIVLTVDENDNESNLKKGAVINVEYLDTSQKGNIKCKLVTDEVLNERRKPDNVGTHTGASTDKVPANTKKKSPRDGFKEKVV